MYVDFFKAGVQRTPEYREKINEMGEAPVLAHGSKKLSQSGVILLYLAERSGKFLPRGEDERLEALALDHFRQSEGRRQSWSLPLRSQLCQATRRACGAGISQRAGARRVGHSRQTLSRSPYVLGAEPTIADISMTSYLYYPSEEFGFDIAGQHKNIGAWLDRMKALPGWAHPYDLMPGHPLPQ